jgi:phosphoglycerate dehydrogenase-like enzyme
MLEFPRIAVHNLHHNAAPTAEMALALLFAAAKFLLPFDRQLRQADWRPRYQPNPSLLLAGKTVLLLGYGHLGQHIGQVCLALGMDVLAIRRRSTQEDISCEGINVHSQQELHALLKRTHALICTLPGTPETEGMIGEQELALMPAGGLLVNVGRGPVVDQAALYSALSSSQLAAAGLDVWYNYPNSSADRANTPPAEFPFHELDNLVMSPHRAGGSDQTEKLRMTHLAACLNAAARGESIPNQVDLESGY